MRSPGKNGEERQFGQWGRIGMPSRQAKQFTWYGERCARQGEYHSFIIAMLLQAVACRSIAVIKFAGWDGDDACQQVLGLSH